MYKLDLSKIFFKLYTLMITFTVFNMLTHSFGITWSEIYNTVSFVSMIIVLFFAIVYFATNLLMSNLSSKLSGLIEDNLTADYIQVLDFWKKTNEFSKNKIVTFGIILGAVQGILMVFF